MTSRKIYIRVRTGSSCGSRSDAKWTEIKVDTTMRRRFTIKSVFLISQNRIFDIKKSNF